MDLLRSNNGDRRRQEAHGASRHSHKVKASWNERPARRQIFPDEIRQQELHLGLQPHRADRGHTGGMKRLLLALPLLVIGSPVLAAPTYLTCEDTKATWNGSPDDRLGTRQIFFDLDTNRASIDGTERGLSATPSEIKISTENINDTLYIFRINRSTLTFTRYMGFLSGRSSKSSGKCQITPAPTNNQI